MKSTTDHVLQTYCLPLNGYLQAGFLAIGFDAHGKLKSDWIRPF